MVRALASLDLGELLLWSGLIAMFIILLIVVGIQDRDTQNK